MAESKDRCWAASLGDCEGKLSLEHYFSECIFPDQTVHVKGFPWCKDNHKPVRIETLGRNMLCEKHNTELSPVDANMPRILVAFEDSTRLLEARRRLSQRHWRHHHFCVDARLLERWCLKTLINLAYRKELDVNLAGPGMAIPAEELVRIAFGRTEFTAPAGLYMRATKNETISVIHGLHITTTVSDRGELVAGQFTIFGHRFVLNLLPGAIRTNDGSSLLHRDVRMYFSTKDDKGRDVRSHLVELVWPSG